MSGTRTARDPLSPELRRLEHQVERGLIAGVGSALPTVLILMAAGVAAGIGPWTPFYGVVALLDGNALLTALGEVARGAEPTFFQQQFVAGFATCLVLAAVSGVVFAIGISKRRFRPGAHYLVGAVHGVLMMCLFYLGALHLLGSLVGETALAMSLSEQIGWPTLVVAHAVHGLGLAWLFRSRLSTERSPFAHLTRPSAPPAA